MRDQMTNHLYQKDLPDDLNLGSVVAIDCETMGLNPHRDRLCLIQLSGGDGNCHLVQVSPGQTTAPNLCKVLADKSVLKLFHYGRFDIAAMAQRQYDRTDHSDQQDQPRQLEQQKVNGRACNCDERILAQIHGLNALYSQ